MVQTKGSNNWFSNLLPAIENAGSYVLGLNKNPIEEAKNTVMAPINQAKQAVNVATDMGAGLAGNSQPQVNQSQNNAINIANQAFKKAQTTSDPAEKQRLLKVANNTLSTVSNNSQNMSNSFSPDVNQNPLWRGAQTATTIATTADLANPLYEQGSKAVNESLANAGNQPGGLQAGFVGKGELPPIKPLDEANPNSTYVKNPDTENIIKNPKFKQKPIIPSEGQDIPGGNNMPPTPPPQGEAPPVEPAPDLPQGPGRTITRINLKPSVYGARDEAQVQNTVDQYVPGNTAEEQYKNLQPTLDNFGKQIDHAIKSSPQTTTLHDTMIDYDKNLEDAGTYRTSASSRGTLQQTAQKYVKQLTGVSENGEISSQSLADSLQKINKDAGPVFKKIAAGSKLTPQDEVILAARQTVRDRLIDMYGGEGGIVDTLLKKQGDLYDAADSLHANRAAEFKATDAANAQAAKDAEAAANAKKEPGWIRKHARTLAEIGVGGVASAVVGGTLYGLPKIGGLITGNQSVKDNNTLPPFKPYNIKTPLDDGSIISTQAQQQRQQAIESKMTADNINDPTGAGATDTEQHKSNETEFNAQADVRTQSVNMKNVQDYATQASNDLRKVEGLGFGNALSKGWNSSAIQNNPAYAGVIADVQNLSNIVKIPLDGATNLKTLQALIDKAVSVQEALLKKAQYEYNPAISAGNAVNTGTNTNINPSPYSAHPALPTNSPPINWQKNDPVVNALTPSGGLPTIR